MRENRYWTVYDLGAFRDYPDEESKIAVFWDCDKAIDYVEYMGTLGKRYGVYDVCGDRIDEE